MKTSKNGKVDKRSKLKKPIDKSRKLVVAQEIKFAQILSGNDDKSRYKVVKALKKWLLSCIQKDLDFKESSFIRIWKGLFYAVWMSDKPLVQEELCESISGLLDLFPPESVHHAMLLFKAGFTVLASSWYGIDQHRMDKYHMLVRRYLRGSLRCLRRCDWSDDSCRLFTDAIAGHDGILAVETPVYARNATSMILHVLDCYLEEIAKVSQGSISPSAVAALLRPACALVCAASGAAGVAARRVLTALLRQSEPGLLYRERCRAWQRMGCPVGGPDALELVSDDDDDVQRNGHCDLHESDADPPESDGDPPESDGDLQPGDGDRPLDPRAGRVDVELPLLPVPGAEIAATLRRLVKDCPKAHRRAKLCLERFLELSAGRYPLRLRAPSPVSAPPGPSRAARALRRLERRLQRSADDLQLRRLNRRQRKRLLARSRAGASIVEQAAALRAGAPPTTTTSTSTSTATVGDWAVMEAEPAATGDRDQENPTGGHRKRKRDKKPDTTDKPAKVKRTGETANGIGDAVRAKSQKHKERTNKAEPETASKSETRERRPSETSDGSESVGRTDEHTQKGRTKKSEKKPNKSPNQHLAMYQRANHDLAETTPKKVQFNLKNNSAQLPLDYYKSVRCSPKIPFDGGKVPTKTNLKPSIASPVNPFALRRGSKKKTRKGKNFAKV